MFFGAWREHPHCHNDVIKWKYFPRNWPFLREIHRSPVNFPHKGQWRRALMFSLIYAWINDWVNNREAGDLRRQHGHYDVIVMAADQQWVCHCWSCPQLAEANTAGPHRLTSSLTTSSFIYEAKHMPLPAPLMWDDWWLLWVQLVKIYLLMKWILIT